MEKEIMKAVVVRDMELLRTIYFDARKGNVFVGECLLRMVRDLIKNNSF